MKKARPCNHRWKVRKAESLVVEVPVGGVVITDLISAREAQELGLEGLPMHGEALVHTWKTPEFSSRVSYPQWERRCVKCGKVQRTTEFKNIQEPVFDAQ